MLITTPPLLTMMIMTLFLDYPTRAKRHAPNIDVDTQRAVTLLKQLDEEELMLLISILDKVFCMHPYLNNTHHKQK